MLELYALFQKIIREKRIELVLESPQRADNVRQRLYRFRNKVRKDSNDPLNLLVDNIRFEQRWTKLILTYSQPNKEILQELINDNPRTGTS